MRRLVVGITLLAAACGRLGMGDPDVSAFHLTFVQQPPSAVGTRRGFEARVQLTDEQGAAVTGVPVVVALELDQNPTGATLDVDPVRTVDGVATFAGVQITVAGSGYSLRARAEHLDPVASNLFDVILNEPPKIRVSFPAENLLAGDLVRVPIHVEDPEGDPVSLRLINPPVGFEDVDAVQQPSPLDLVARWRVPDESGVQQLYFAAQDHYDPPASSIQRAEVRLHGGNQIDGYVFGDVTGDGLPDLVAGARLADFGQVADAGALYVFAGSGDPSGFPDSTLFVPNAVASDQLTNTNAGQGIQLADVNGDGVVDVIAGAANADFGGVQNVGAVYVWLSPLPSGFVAPSASLRIPAATTNDQLGNLVNGTGIQIADVTADGVSDIVVGAALSDQAGSDRGAVYVWSGGTKLDGEPAPLATLIHPNSDTGDQLGNIGSGQGVLLADVTGDGVDDIIVGCSLARADDRGEIYVWQGDAGLAGNPAPSAVLQRPVTAAGDEVGFIVNGQGILLGDVSGDGVLDVVAGATFADEGVSNAGAVYVWEGGMALSGYTNPRAELYDNNNATQDDQLGSNGSRQGMVLADVTGDDILDVIVGTSLSDVSGFGNAGAIYVWAGGATMVGAPPAPRAVLYDTAFTGNEQLGNTSGFGLIVDDITGDGVSDIVAGSTISGVGPNQGSIHVWAGGTGLAGPGDTATLILQVDSDTLSGNVTGQAIQIADVTGDGALDVISATSRADTGVNDVGLVAVWPGPTFAGVMDGSVLQPAGLSAGDTLSQATTGQAVRLEDVTGDGVRDVIAVAESFDGSANDEGAIFVWQGRAALGTATALPLDADFRLGVAAVNNGQRLGNTEEGSGVLISDVTGDGVADILACTHQYDFDAGTADTGALFIWPGAASLSPTPAVGVMGAAPVAGDNLCRTSGQAVRTTDFDGDGIRDVFAAGNTVDVGGAGAAGAIFFQPGGASLTASPVRELSNPAARNNDQLTAVH